MIIREASLEPDCCVVSCSIEHTPMHIPPEFELEITNNLPLISAPPWVFQHPRIGRFNRVRTPKVEPSIRDIRPGPDF